MKFLQKIKEFYMINSAYNWKTNENVLYINPFPPRLETYFIFFYTFIMNL